MPSRPLADLSVFPIGLGAMPMSIEGRPDRARSIATIHAALDAGVTLIDTACSYHLHADEVGHNEKLVAEAVASWGQDTDDVIIATKGGHLRPGDGTWTVNGDPGYLKQAARESAKALGVEAIDLYYFHRPDPAVPYADSVGALKELLDEGVIVRAGVSNANVDQIRQAHEILGASLAAVQNQFSPSFRSSEPELDLCEQLNIAFLPWSPLGGISSAGKLGNQHPQFETVARVHGVSPQQVALAWELAKGQRVIPIPGASRPESILDSAKAATLSLTADELAALG